MDWFDIFFQLNDQGFLFFGKAYKNKYPQCIIIRDSLYQYVLPHSLLITLFIWLRWCLVTALVHCLTCGQPIFSPWHFIWFSEYHQAWHKNKQKKVVSASFFLTVKSLFFSQFNLVPYNK